MSLNILEKETIDDTLNDPLILTVVDEPTPDAATSTAPIEASTIETITTVTAVGTIEIERHASWGEKIALPFKQLWLWLKTIVSEVKRIVREANAEVVEARKQERMARLDRARFIIVEKSVVPSPVSNPIEAPVAEILEEVGKTESGDGEEKPFFMKEADELRLSKTPEALADIKLLIKNGREIAKDSGKKMAKEIGYIVSGLEYLKKYKKLSKTSLRDAIRKEHNSTIQAKTLDKIFLAIEAALKTTD